MVCVGLCRGFLWDFETERLGERGAPPGSTDASAMALGGPMGTIRGLQTRELLTRLFTRLLSRPLNARFNVQADLRGY